MNEILEIMLVFMVPVSLCVFFVFLYASHRANKRYERKEMGQKQYQKYQSRRTQKKIPILFMVIGVILFLIGCYGFQTEPRFIIRETVLEVVEVNPVLVILFFLSAFWGGGLFLAGGLAIFVYALKKGFYRQRIKLTTK